MGAGQLTLLDTAKTFQDQSAPAGQAQLTAVHIASVEGRAFAFAFDTTANRVITYEVLGDALVYRSDTSISVPFFGQEVNEVNEGAAPRGLLLMLPVGPPFPGECRNPVVRPRKAERRQIGMQLLQGSTLLARLRRLRLQPGRQLLRKRVELTWPVRSIELRLEDLSLQKLLHGIA